MFVLILILILLIGILWYFATFAVPPGTDEATANAREKHKRRAQMCSRWI